jgi:hypothetical protein
MEGHRTRPFLRLILMMAIATAFCGSAFASATQEFEICVGATCVGPTHTTNVPGGKDYVAELDGWVVSAFGTSNTPHLGLMDNNTLVTCTALSCVGAGDSLTVKFTDKSFTPIGDLNTTFSGDLTAMTATQSAYFDTSNTLFGTGHLIGMVGPFGPGVFSGEAGDGAPGHKPYSLTIADSFTAGNDTTDSATTFGAIDPIPEPRSMILFGSGLLLMASLIRRLRHA